MITNIILPTLCYSGSPYLAEQQQPAQRGGGGPGEHAQAEARGSRAVRGVVHDHLGGHGRELASPGSQPVCGGEGYGSHDDRLYR